MLVLAIAIIYMIQPPYKPQQQQTQQPQEEKYAPAVYEITKDDILSLDNFTAREVSVMGVQLDDSLQDIVNKIGEPDGKRDYAGNITNLEYSSAIKLNQTGLIIHLKNGKVKRITMREPFNAYLVGKTKINHDKAEIYSILGKPDDLKHVPISQGSPIVYRLLEYYKKGIEVTMRRGMQNGLGLVDSSSG